MSVLSDIKHEAETERLISDKARLQFKWLKKTTHYYKLIGRVIFKINVVCTLCVIPRSRSGPGNSRIKTRPVA